MSGPIHDSVVDDESSAIVTNSKQIARQEAIRVLRSRRRFWVRTNASAIGMLLLTAIWATVEYHNAGGWPVHGFSQSSGIHEVWNSWIIYPVTAWVLITGASAWATFGLKPISEREIKREMERQADHETAA
jgi:hypothetical protein